MNINFNSIRKLILCGFMLTAFVGIAVAQNDPMYVIRKGDNYLSHSLQNATSFSPDCIWYSSNNYNYYFMDGTTRMYLKAPLTPDGAITVAENPGTNTLNNTTLDYFFYDWDHGLARGIQHFGGTCDPNYHGLSDNDECWEVVWVCYENSAWKMSSNYSYNATSDAAQFTLVHATEHAVDTTTMSGGLTNLEGFAMNFSADPLASQQVTPVINNYQYTVMPAYTTYVFDGHTYHYYDGSMHDNIPTAVNSVVNPASSATYSWTLEGDGAAFLSFEATGSTYVHTSTASAPTVYYRESNDQGHKAATLTLTVTYDDGSKQTSSAVIMVNTPCQNPTGVTATPNNIGATISWTPTAESYLISWKKTSDENWITITVGNISTYTITALEYGEVEYTYKVKATSCNTEEPETHTFKTLANDPGLLVVGAIFGGGRMADVDGKTDVVVVNCNSIGEVYGGNDIAGAVKGDNGSTITLGVDTGDPFESEGTTNKSFSIGSVYGGGNGYYTYDDHEPGSAIGTTELIDGTFSASVTEVGGSSSYMTAGTIPSIEKTTITVNNDFVKVDSLFGGAKNAFLTTNSGNGSSITIDGGTLFAVFGGNNYGGTQGYGKHYIEVNHTTTNLVGNIENTETTGYGRDFGIRYLFGGGNKVYGSTTEVVINGGQCDTVFAGGNSADVYMANLTVNCAMGGDGTNNTWNQVYSNAIDTYLGGVITPKDDYKWDGFSGVYNVRTLFGGNNQATFDSQLNKTVPNIQLTSGSIGTVYGGGNAGDMWGLSTNDGTAGHGDLTINGTIVKYGTHLKMDSPNILIDNLYGGCQVSSVRYSTWVELLNGHVGTVYGGCNVSGDVGSTLVNTGAPEIPTTMEEQAVWGGTYVVASGGVVYKNLFGGGNGFYHCVNEYGVYQAGLDYGDPNHLYIGLSTPTHNETHVIVNEGALVKGSVYAGGNLASVGFSNNTVGSNPYPKLVGLSSVRMSGGTVNGNVYGGGNMAVVYGNNEAIVSGGTIGKALYGGNDRLGKVAQISNRISEYQTASDGATTLTSPKIYTYVKLTGDPTITNVYGGGNGDYAYFESFDAAQAYTGDKETVVCCDVTDWPIQRSTFVDVNIDGGEHGGHLGTVYGGGDGVTVSEFLKVFYNVNGEYNNYSNVGTIFGGNNKGPLEVVADIILLNGQVNTVYGGCNQGAMQGGKTITSGTETYDNVGSYVRLINSYDPDGDGPAPAVAATAKVKEAVYGGCRMNGVTKTSLVLVEGGDYSATGPYNIPIFGGSDISGNSGASEVVVCGGTVGNAYGGGNGHYDYTAAPYLGLTAPYSANSSFKILSGTADNLFAGGYSGLCGDTYGYVEGGTVNKVFGGGNLAGTTTQTIITGSTVDGSSNVYVNGGTVNHSVYGGCNAEGDIEGPVSVYFNGGTIGSATARAYGVFGGGFGEATETSGEVSVYIGEDESLTPTLYGDVYGGSAMGQVNDAVADITKVQLKKGTIHGDLYGGGFGDNNKNATVNGSVDVVIDGGTVVAREVSTGVYEGGRVFGCNNLNGTPLGPVSVTVNHTNPTQITLTNDTIYAIQGVYGGGNLAAYLPTENDALASVEVNDCASSIKDVYGGGNAAPVPATDVTINGGIIDRAFAGGNGVTGTAHVGYNNTTTESTENPYGTGMASLTVTGGTINKVFGGSNNDGLIRQQSTVSADANGTCELHVDELYGGGNQANGNSALVLVNSHCTGSDGEIGDVYGGARAADINGNIELNITGGHINRVFGGNNISGIVEGTIVVNVEWDGATCPGNYLGYVYGGGNAAAYNAGTTNYPEVNIKNGTVDHNVFGGGLGVTATVTGNPKVTIGDASHTNYTALVNENVYGGGDAAAVTGNPMVYVNNSNTNISNVFGAGKGSLTDVSGVPALEVAKVNGNTTVTLQGGLVSQNVYGGGELGSTAGQANVNVTGGAVGISGDTSVGNVFGGGLGDNSNAEAGRVESTTNVTIYGGNVYNNVFGGGSLASVTEDTYVSVHGGTVHHNVFGAGRGTAGMTNFTFVPNTHVNIEDEANVKGNVFGSGDNGHVTYDTHVTMTGGTVGNVGSDTDGNLFGGGRGIDLTSTNTISASAGQVGRDTYVTFSGGTVKNNVFGGGYYASVLGNANVTVNNQAIVGVNTNANGGNVFGAGCGVEDPYPAITPAIPFEPQNYARIDGITEVNVAGSAAVLSSVYGGGKLGYVFNNSHSEVTSTVNIASGIISLNVFGGGDMGKTIGDVVVNMNGGEVHGELFGGAKGSSDEIFVAGLKTVNMRGGIVYNDVYGGSRNANDGNSFAEPAHSTNYTAFVNVSGGTVRQNVYGAGFFGRMFGSSDVNVGTVAINNANPTYNIHKGDHTITSSTTLHIIKNIYAGSNWGDYDPSNGQGFGASTTSGQSNIYVDGSGYNTEEIIPSYSTYMSIDGSLYGSGTSCDGGTTGRKIQVANYGVPIIGPQSLEPLRDGGTTFNVVTNASRSFNSVQRCDVLIFDNVSVKLIGQGDISQPFSSINYSIHNIPKRDNTYPTGVFIRNGSNIVVNNMIDDVHAVYSQYRPESSGLYSDNPTVYWIGINEKDPTTTTDEVLPFYYNNGTSWVELPEADINTFRFNSGSSLYVRYYTQYNVASNQAHTDSIAQILYGELQGFFRIVTEDNNETFAHARPKRSEGSTNVADGGFMSYFHTGHNTFIDTELVGIVNHTNYHQFPYVNVLPTRNDESYFRYWRMRTTPNANLFVMERDVLIQSNPNSPVEYVSVTLDVILPPMDCEDGFFELHDINFGDDAHIVDAGIYHPNVDDEYYLLWKEGVNNYPHSQTLVTGPGAPENDTLIANNLERIKAKPNTFFGLVMEPAGCLSGITGNKAYNLSENAKDQITHVETSSETRAGVIYKYPTGGLSGQTEDARVTLRFTYYKTVTQNASLSPVTVEFMSYCGDPNALPTTWTAKDLIQVPITITTQTVLGQDIDLMTYAMFESMPQVPQPDGGVMTYKVKAALPNFDLGSWGADGIPFYVYQQSYSQAQGTETPKMVVTDPASNPYTFTQPDGDHTYAMTIMRSTNSDNINGWVEAVGAANIPENEIHQLNPDVTTNTVSYFGTSAVRMGKSTGRKPFTLDFILKYFSTDLVNNNMRYAKGLIGTVAYKVCYPVTESGLSVANSSGVPTNVETNTNWNTFTINVGIYKRTTAANFYIDGENGSNYSNSGTFANDGKLNLQGVLEDDAWLPGDNIYVVRPIHITASNVNTIWKGNQGGEPIVLHRYIDPCVADSLDDAAHYFGLDPGPNTGINGNPKGAAFAIVTNGRITYSGIVLDGMEHTNNPNQDLMTPLISVSNGGTVVLSSGTEIGNTANRATSNANGANPLAGAVYVGSNGNLLLQNGATISGNYAHSTASALAAGTAGAGAVYVEAEGDDPSTYGNVVVGNLVNVTGNRLVVGNDTIICNLTLPKLKSVVIIDQDNALLPESRIGIYKDKHLFYPSGENQDLTPIVTSASPEYIRAAFTYGNFKDDTRRAYTYYYAEDTLYYGRTWAHFVTNNNAYPADPEGFEPGTFTINTVGDQEYVTVTGTRAFAWLISYVNGLNGQQPHYGDNIHITLDADVNLGKHFWKPLEWEDELGNKEYFKGTIDGQWKDIDSIVIKREGFRDLGILAQLEDGGVVKNVLLHSADIWPWNPDNSEQYAGGIVGTVKAGGIVTGCEAAPTLDAEKANSYTYMGGLAGRVDNGGMVHSVIGMPKLHGYAMGGIVGKIESGGNLFNSYANLQEIQIETGKNAGGLVGYNLGIVENCYSQLQGVEPASNFGWFAGTNTGTGVIQYCYAPEGETNYKASGIDPIGHGNFSTTLLERKDIGYLYDDNKVSLAAGVTNNPHYCDTIIYTADDGSFAGHITRWRGLVSLLGHWVKEKNAISDNTSIYYQKDFAPWFRPATKKINGDMPVLGLAEHNSLAALDNDSLFLEYGQLDNLLDTHTEDASLLVYANAVDVTKVPNAEEKVFVHEDAVLMQKDGAGDFEATVGVTFDNSWRQAHDYFNNTLLYDWHLMSTPLSDAPMGTSYNMSLPMFFSGSSNLTSMTNGYFPNGLPIYASTATDIAWDFYSYDEPDYHWINFKRSTGNHWHMDTIAGNANPPIHCDTLTGELTTPYNNESNYIPGKGYMMGISQDSYMNNTGILNKGNVQIDITRNAPKDVEGKPTYDRGSNLIGNPYQAYLDLDEVKKENDFLKGFWIYDADQGVYAPYDKGASVNPAIPSQYIHPHQGFFVVVNANETVTFKPDMAGTTHDDQSYFRGERPRYPLVNLYVSDVQGNRDLSIVEFKRPETGGVKKISNLRNADFNLYTHFEDENWGLLYTPKKTARVPVFFKTTKNGTYTLSWDTYHGTFTTMRLIDNLLGVNYDMLANDHYTFEANATDYASRFYIVFNVTDVEEFEEEQENFAYYNGDGWVVEGEGQLELVDMLGHVLYANHLSGEPTIVHFDDFAAGMYMLRLVNSHKVLKAQKIILK